GVKVGVIEVTRCSPDDTDLRELLLERRDHSVEECLLNAVRSARPVVGIERASTVVQGVGRVPADTLPPRLELSDSCVPGLPPLRGLGQSATTSESPRRENSPACELVELPVEVAVDGVLVEAVDSSRAAYGPDELRTHDALAAAELEVADHRVVESVDVPARCVAGQNTTAGVLQLGRCVELDPDITERVV